MDEKYISVTKFKETLAKLIVEGGTEATRTTIARTLGEVVPKLLDDEPFADVQPVVHAKWEISSDGYYPYCSRCFGRPNGELTKYCPDCGARMDLDSVTHDRCSNYMDCDGHCFIDDTPCDCDGNIEKCKGR